MAGHKNYSKNDQDIEKIPSLAEELHEVINQRYDIFDEKLEEIEKKIKSDMDK